MSVKINDNIRIRASKLTDERSGPYISKDQALTSININERKEGLPVIIIEDGKQKEYWFEGGIQNQHLVPKPAGSGGGFDYETPIDDILNISNASIQKAILSSPMTTINGMNRSPGESGILLLKQDDVGAKYYRLSTVPGNIGNIYNDNFLPRAIIALRWYRDDENCYWSIERVIKGIYPTTVPVFKVDDYLNTLEVFHTLPSSEVLISENNGPWMPYTGIINVGPVDRPEGYWRAYVAGDSTRTESPIAYSRAFSSIGKGFTYTFNFELS